MVTLMAHPGYLGYYCGIPHAFSTVVMIVSLVTVAFLDNDLSKIPVSSLEHTQSITSSENLILTHPTTKLRMNGKLLIFK